MSYMSLKKNNNKNTHYKEETNTIFTKYYNTAVIVSKPLPLYTIANTTRLHYVN